MYSEEVRKYFENPINMGIIKDADGIGVTENEICSDIIKIYISINKDNIITDAKFEVKGCPPVLASCCVVTEMIKNMNIDEAKEITAKEIIEKLNGLPKEKEHCAELVEITLKKAIINFIGNGEIELDNIDTWGNALKKLLLELSEIETLFEEKWIGKTIYEKLKKDSSYKDETKIYNQQKSNILKRIQENISSRKIICYHCTRLTKYDYDSIKKSGLIVCSKEKQIERIKKIGLDKKEENQLIKGLEAKDLSRREGKIHFIYSLKNIDAGCISFLKYWGGESIYDNINEIKIVKNKILNSSKPYIVKFTIKYSETSKAFLIENMQKKLKCGKMERRRFYR